jgi:hypothetical protein
VKARQFILPLAHELAVDKPPRRLRKHGLSYTPEYRAWQQMRLRCTDPEHEAWPDYGGRGITVCPEWLDSPQQFLADMGKKPSPKHEIDRADNDGPYCPENCRWVLRKVNCRNRRSNVVLELDGQSLTLVEWSERTGLAADAIQKRIRAGWPVALALRTPARAKAPNGQAKSLQRHPCAVCSAPTGATLCKPCANRANGARNPGRRPVQACDVINAIREAA